VLLAQDRLNESINTANTNSSATKLLSSIDRPQNSSFKLLSMRVSLFQLISFSRYLHSYIKTSIFSVLKTSALFFQKHPEHKL